MKLSDKVQLRLSLFLFLFLASGLVFVGCDAGGSGGPPKNDDLTGTITGEVIDNVTSQPIEGATVTVAAGSLGTDSTFTATTGSDGTFAITNVPVSGAASDSSNPSETYGIRLETPSNAPYRAVYRSQVEVVFGDGGSGAVSNVVANVTFPLTKTNGTVSGQVLVEGGGERQFFNQGAVVLTQDMPIQFDADGTPTSTMEVAITDTTDSKGNFSISGAMVGRTFDLWAVIGNDRQSLTSGKIPANKSSVTIDDTAFPSDFRIVNVAPKPPVDVGSNQPSFTFTFNRPVADNEFNRADASLTGLNNSNEGDHLVDELYVQPVQAKSMPKDLRPDGNIPVDVSFNSDRTELTVKVAEPLDDGFNYRHVALGFQDNRFVDAYGIPLEFNSQDRGDINFSVGINESKPAVPSVSFEDQDGDEETINDPGTLNYVDNSVTAELRIDDIDNSQAPVKGYEVYYRSQNQAGRDGTGDQFVKATDVTPEASFGQFEDSDGIIPASAVSSDETDDGELEFTVDVFNSPLQADNDSYGPIEWKVRAVSINNVRSDFTSVITTGDNTKVDVVSAFATDEDGDGNDDFITVRFSEPLTTGSVDLADFTLEDGSGNTRPILDSIRDAGSGDQSGREVEVALQSGNNINFGDQVVVQDVKDLAGNDVDASDDTATF